MNKHANRKNKSYTKTLKFFLVLICLIQVFYKTMKIMLIEKIEQKLLMIFLFLREKSILQNTVLWVYAGEHKVISVE